MLVWIVFDFSSMSHALKALNLSQTVQRDEFDEIQEEHLRLSLDVQPSKRSLVSRGRKRNRNQAEEEDPMVVD